MMKVSLKYFIRNKKNYSFYSMLFIISIVSIFAILSNDLYYFKTFTQNQEENYSLVTVNENEKKILKESGMSLEACEPYLDTTKERCKTYISIGNEDIIYELDNLGIEHIVYTKFYDIINAKKIGKIIKVLTIIIGVFLLILFIPIIKLKLNKEISLKRILCYLGYSRKDIILFDIIPLIVLLPTLFLLEYIILILFLNVISIGDFFLRNIIYITFVILIVNLLLFIEYIIMLFLLRKNNY